MSASDASQQANRAGMDAQRLMVIGYLVLGLVSAMFLGHLAEMVLLRFGVTAGRPFSALDFTWVELASYAAVAGLAFYLWTNEKTHAVSIDVAGELLKVTWPSWDETRVATMAVVVASVVASLVLFAMDVVSFRIMVDWIPQLWSQLRGISQ